MAALARSSASLTASRSAQRTAVRPAVSKGTVSSLRLHSQRAAAPSISTSSSSVVAKVGAVEVAQIAGEAGFITGTAVTMVALTLIGLALGFVLLRVESLVEEGKL